jgi:hypothetical protein
VIELEKSNAEIGHYVMQSRYGYRYMMIQCPLCKIWIDGPVFIEENGVHLIETWPAEEDAHDIVEIASGWQRRLVQEAEIPLDALHIHVQLVNLYLHPDWLVLNNFGSTQYYLSGELVEEPWQVFQGKYDAVFIHLVSNGERTPKQLEELILHELVHIAFPKALRTLERDASRNKSFESAESEKWVNAKTKQLLRQHGYLLHQRSADPKL